jgi:hypothetical protein
MLDYEDVKDDPDFNDVVNKLIDLVPSVAKLVPKFDKSGYIYNLVQPLERLMRDMDDFIPGEQVHMQQAISALCQAYSDPLDKLITAELEQARLQS